MGCTVLTVTHSVWSFLSACRPLQDLQTGILSAYNVDLSGDLTNVPGICSSNVFKSVLMVTFSYFRSGLTEKPSQFVP